MTGLEVNDLTVTYGQDTTVVHNVSFEARPGRITALLGPNGSGKSTILKAVTGLIPSSGSVHLDTALISKLSPRERASVLAYVPQRSALTSPLRVKRVVELGRYAQWSSYGGLSSEGEAIVQQAMERTQVSQLSSRPFTELSGGEQQRVLLARAIATGAKTMVLDEPTSALDIYHSLQFRRLLHELRQDGFTILIVLHDLNEANETADDGVLLLNGHVLATGPIDHVIAPAPLYEAYQVHLSEERSLRFGLDPT